MKCFLLSLSVLFSSSSFLFQNNTDLLHKVSQSRQTGQGLECDRLLLWHK